MVKRLLILVLVLTALVAGWFWLPLRPGESFSANPEAVQARALSGVESGSASGNASGQSGEPVGTAILRDYANPAKTPEHDLALMAQLMENFLLLVKTAADRPLSANEEWSRALRGLNPGHERFLPDNHVALNGEKQLVDRWGTPLFFHSVGRGHFEIRSAGPDRRMWTDDDIRRNPDGAIVHGTAPVKSETSPK